MASEESDDEPLATLAAAKRRDPDKFVDITLVPAKLLPLQVKKKKLKMKKTRLPKLKKLPLTIKLDRVAKKNVPPPVVERPTDVWMYLKDLNPTGPYSCLLCSEWFINRLKIVVHYILNHKKDFCGICRYFVPDRESWWSHQMIHTPWTCSQCMDSFSAECDLRVHLSSAHQLVHCRFCHFRVSDNDQYNTHLIQKHSVTNVTNKNAEIFWELEFEDSQKFLCLLCLKSDILSSNFYQHYMSYHHFTVKCFANLISGTDPPFLVYGADITPQFVETIKGHKKYGYVDLSKQQPNESYDGVLNLQVKLEEISDAEANNDKQENDKSHFEVIKGYKGEEDFDVTLTELIVIQKCYFDYLRQIQADLDTNSVPHISYINYEKAKADVIAEINCSLCNTLHSTVQSFVTHMYKMHTIKSVSLFWCRVCATTFDTQNELDIHVTQELGEFEDLWICQFCDKEFDSRKDTRIHLTEHWGELQFDTCFSPHLGFKCRYCPTLFWNEPDRETHHVKVHFTKYKGDYYKCESCNEIFSDKIWFTYHHVAMHVSSDSDPLYLLKCVVCCLVLPGVDEMRTHFRAEHPEARKIFCSLDACQYRPLSHKKSFQLHLRSQHSKITRKDMAAVCSICSRQFPTTRARSAHIAAAHGNGKYKCLICKEMLHSIDERKLHYLIAHPGQHPYRCTECGKSFQYKSSLYMHKQEHSPEKLSFTCTYCQKVFKKKDSFREHLQIHEGPRHACSYCPMRFVQRSNMLRHERRHTGERPYACPHCDRTFADKGACTSHAKTHSREEPYTCLYCGKQFVQKAKLKYHIRKHTGENLETCPVCSKLFTSVCALREHMKTHGSKKSPEVQCPLCDRKYRDERYMLRHLRESHTRGQFTCPLCGKMLSNATGLRHHVLTHSRENAFRCKFCPTSYSVKRTIVRHLRKRHSIKGSSMKEFYIKLDPRECRIDLDEETMTSLFGPPKKPTVNLLADFVTYTNNLDKASSSKADVNNESGSDDNDDDDEESKGSQSEEVDPGVNEELEPTDFVSIKIEHMDENEDE